MSTFQAVLLATFVVLVVVNCCLFKISSHRAERRRKEILERVRLERAAEKRRTERTEQLVYQDLIGDEIVTAWVHAWKQAGRPPKRKIFRVRSKNPNSADETYFIGVGHSDNPFDMDLRMIIDLREKGKEISLVAGARKFLRFPKDPTTFGLEGGRGLLERSSKIASSTKPSGPDRKFCSLPRVVSTLVRAGLFVYKVF